MRLITTTFRYGIKDDGKLEEATEALVALNLHEDALSGYQAIVLTEDEYLNQWYLFDKITHVREVK